MLTLLTADDVGNYLAQILSVNPLWKDETLSVSIIANPKAGSFTRVNYSVKNKKLFEQACERASLKTKTVATINMNIYRTEYSGHAEELTNAIIAEICAQPASNNANLIVSAGGDGTGLEIQTALFKAAHSSEIKHNTVVNKIALLRMPFGTGNDGTDGHTLEETLALLENPAHFSNARAIKVTCAKNADKEQLSQSTKVAQDLVNCSESPWYAFNIASIGIDAYITYMTNKMKSAMPGDSYRFWVVAACALYDKQFKATEATIDLFDESGNKIDSVRTKVEFALLGVSGHRNYGSNQHILPDNDNVCITPKMSLIQKMAVNKCFAQGTHYEKNLSIHKAAEKICIHYNGTILAQMDGEARLLCAENFPLTIERTEPCIRIIESDSLTFDKGAVAAANQ